MAHDFDGYFDDFREKRMTKKIQRVSAEEKPAKVKGEADVWQIDRRTSVKGKAVMIILLLIAKDKPSFS